MASRRNTEPTTGTITLTFKLKDIPEHKELFDAMQAVVSKNAITAQQFAMYCVRYGFPGAKLAAEERYRELTGIDTRPFRNAPPLGVDDGAASSAEASEEKGGDLEPPAGMHWVQVQAETLCQRCKNKRPVSTYFGAKDGKAVVCVECVRAEYAGNAAKASS